MTAPFENIVQHLFHQPSLQSVTVDELKRVTDENPSFAAAHFLLLKKLQETAHPGFRDQLQKTTLYFNNPLWLQFLLNPAKEKVSESPFSHEIVQEQIQSTDTVEQPYQNVVELAEIASAEHMEESVYSSNGNGNITESHSEVSYTHVSTTVQEDAHEPPASFEAIESEDANVNAVHPILEEPQPALIESEVKGPEAEAETLVDSSPDAYSQSEAEANATDAPVLENLQQQNFFAEKTMAETNIIVETTPSAKSDILFEPFHTVDYFASQGIKLDKTEPNSQDKLGKQLKSFTEWLKSMKKLPKVSVDKILAENDESVVVAAANSSVEAKEVITEAMAQVLEKQGLTEKAMEVYHKLSLLNPAKSAYFAAKIEDLKK